MTDFIKWNDASSQWECANAPDSAALETRIAALETLLAGVTRAGNDIT